MARILSRLPIRAVAAGKRAPTACRFTSRASSTGAAASRIVEMASRADRPDAAQAAVPVMWAVCGLLTCTAWNRMSESSAGANVETLLIV